MKAWFAAFLLMSILGCDPKTTVKKSQVDLRPKHVSSDSKFDFQIAKGKFPKKGQVGFNIPFLLVNTSLDTLHLASTTCYGPSPFLETDTTQLQFSTLTECLGNSMIIERILPKDTLRFTQCIYNKNATDSIKIGFRFVDAHGINLQYFPLLGREANSIVIWKTMKI